MNVISSECIILRNRDFRERDRMVTFLARDRGKLTGIARGAQKPTSRGISVFEPYTRGTIYYVEKAGAELVAIRKCDPVPPYLLLHAGYEGLLYAGYFTELIELIAIGADETPLYFDLLASHLEALTLGAGALPQALTRLSFELDYVRLLGVQPDWGRCVVCGRALARPREAGPAHPSGQLLAAAPWGQHVFDVHLGGVRCPDCVVRQGGMPVLSPGTMAFFGAWRRHRADPRVKPTRLALTELETVVAQHLIRHLERVPRSLALLPSLTEPGARDSQA